MSIFDIETTREANVPAHIPFEDVGIHGADNAFKLSNDPALAGWNLLMELRELFNQITTTYG